MLQKRNETTWLIWIAPHRPFIPLGSQSSKLPRGTSSLEQMRLLGHVITKQCCEIQSVGAFDLKRRCTEWSVYDIKVPRESFESIGLICSYRSRGTLMSYTDHSVQRRFKSNTPENTSRTWETLCNETVRRLFNMHIAIIYHGFTVVTFTALWYCGRNVG